MVVRLLTSRDCGEKPAIQYNLEKVIDGTASIIGIHLDGDDSLNGKDEDNGSYYFDPIEADIARYGVEITAEKPTIFDVLHRLRAYEHANLRTVRPWFHMAVNPGPKDDMLEEDIIRFIDDLMAELGLGNQPYCIFKHEDISRTHNHIISIKVDQCGRKIHPMRRGKDGFLKPYKLEERSCLQAMVKLQHKYGYQIGAGPELDKIPQVFDAEKGHLHQQIEGIIREELKNPLIYGQEILKESSRYRGVDIDIRESKFGKYIVAKGLDENGEKVKANALTIGVSETAQILERIKKERREKEIDQAQHIGIAIYESHSPKELRKTGIFESQDQSPEKASRGSDNRYDIEDIYPGVSNLLHPNAKTDFDVLKTQVINRQKNFIARTCPSCNRQRLPEDYCTLKAQDICKKMNSSESLNSHGFRTPVKPVSLEVEHPLDKIENWNGPGKMVLTVEDADGKQKSLKINEKGQILLKQMDWSNHLYDVNKGVVITESAAKMENNHGQIRRGR